MTKEELYSQLLCDLRQLNLPIDEVEIYLRPFSATYYGRYFPVHNDKEHKPKIYVYPYENIKGDLMTYDVIISTAIHELCHHIQYTDKCFKRVKGVMHDPQFWKLYNHYVERATKYNIIGGVTSAETKGLCV